MKSVKQRWSALGLAIGGFAAMFAITAPASAHHGIGVEFDMSKQITVVGTVQEMDWTNPHAWLSINVKDDQGKTQVWRIEFGGANNLYRRGWRRDDLPVGASVTVTGYPSRDGSPSVGATDVKLPDGRTLFAGPKNSRRPPSGS
jgi:hypothetical protein